MTLIQEDVELDSIQRCPHDSDNPYTMILNSLLRNPSLTPNCRWLLSFLLSNDKGWKIKPKAIINHLEPHMKKDSVYKIINEAIDHGYMRKEECRKNGKFGGFKYFISETPKFKKILPRLEKPDTVLSDPVKPTLKKEQEIKKEQCLKNNQYHALSLSSFQETQKERKKALKKEIEFRDGRFQNISSEQIDSWKRAYPGENIEAYIAQFESVLTLSPHRIFSKTPWSGRLNAWIRTQSQEKDRMKFEVVQSKESIKQENPKQEPIPYAETNFWYSQSAKDLVNEWSEKLGSKGILSFLSNILSLKIFSTNESWNIPIDDKRIVKFLEFIPEKIKKEIQLPQT